MGLCGTLAVNILFDREKEIFEANMAKYSFVLL